MKIMNKVRELAISTKLAVTIFLCCYGGAQLVVFAQVTFGSITPPSESAISFADELFRRGVQYGTFCSLIGYFALCIGKCTKSSWWSILRRLCKLDLDKKDDIR